MLVVDFRVIWWQLGYFYPAVRGHTFPFIALTCEKLGSTLC